MKYTYTRDTKLLYFENGRYISPLASHQIACKNNNVRESRPVLGPDKKSTSHGPPYRPKVVQDVQTSRRPPNSLDQVGCAGTSGYTCQVEYGPLLAHLAVRGNPIQTFPAAPSSHVMSPLPPHMCLHLSHST
jgi:hypothetical protein